MRYLPIAFLLCQYCVGWFSTYANMFAVGVYTFMLILLFKFERLGKGADAAAIKSGSKEDVFYKTVRWFYGNDDDAAKRIRATIRQGMYDLPIVLMPRDIKGIRKEIKSKYPDLYKKENTWFEEQLNLDDTKVQRRIKAIVGKAKADLGVGSAWNTANTNKSKNKAQANADAGVGPQLSFIGVSNKLLAIIIDTAIKIRDGAITMKREIPQDCKPYFKCFRNKSESKKGARIDYTSIMAYVYKLYDTCLGYEAEDLQDMTHEELHKDVEKEIRGQWEEQCQSEGWFMDVVNLCRFTAQSVKTILGNLADSLYNGHSFMLPCKLDPESDVVYWIAFTVGGTPKSNFVHKMVYLKTIAGLPSAVLVLFLNKTICPGMSNWWHDGQGDNDHPMHVAGSILVSTTGCLNFNTDTHPKANGAVGIKDKSVDTKPYEMVSVTINGKSRMVSKLYPTKRQVKSGNNTMTQYQTNVQVLKEEPTYKREKSSGRKRKKDSSPSGYYSDETKFTRKVVSVHQFNNILAKGLGLLDVSPEGKAFMRGEGVSEGLEFWESLYLKTGEMHMTPDADADLVVSQMMELYGVDESDLPPEMGGGSDEESVNIPQGQCDVDHCLHRAYLICNSIYLCHPMSHTANQCNSVIRKACGEWCYGIGDQEYVRGE